MPRHLDAAPCLGQRVVRHHTLDVVDLDRASLVASAIARLICAVCLAPSTLPENAMSAAVQGTAAVRTNDESCQVLVVVEAMLRCVPARKRASDQLRDRCSSKP